MLSNARFLVIALVVSAAISLAWQYHGAQRGAVDSGTADQSVLSNEAGVEKSVQDQRNPTSEASAGQTRVTTGSETDLKNKEQAGEQSLGVVARHEETYVFEYDEAWIGDFYTRLHSPDPLPDNEPGVLPVISGRVLTPRGQPVEGVEVTAEFRNYFKDAPRSSGNTIPRVRKTKTNDDGFYAFDSLPGGIYMIATEESSQYSAARREVRTGVKYADLVLDPQRYAIVRGTVTDPMGAKLSQVRVMPLVKGLPSGTTTDSNGEFALGVALGQDVRRIPLRFRLDGFREQSYEVTELDAAIANEIQVAVTMEPVYEFTTVSGSVKGVNGTQIVGDYVRLYSPSLKRSYKAKIDDAGEYLFANVEIADDYQLWVRPTGPFRDFSEKNFVVSPGSVRRDLVLQPLNRFHRLSGRIIDRDGSPIPNYTLALRSMAATGQKMPVTSDAHGRFEVENVPEGELIFESQTMPYHKISGLYLDGDRSDRSVDLVINHGRHKLLGKVVDDAGNPVPTPRIFITTTQVSGNGMRSHLKGATSADAKGRFLFTGLGNGRHLITVYATGYERVRTQLDVGNQRELVIKLEKNRT